MGLAVFLAIPAVTRVRNHVVIDLLDETFAPVRRFQLLVTDLINAAIFALMAWQVWDQGAKAEEYGDLSQMLMLPMGPIYKTLSILAGLATVTALVNLIEGQLGRSSASPGADAPDLQHNGTGL
jgi:TRAP-type C4-dicarboxylate transport system permease small subunit